MTVSVVQIASPLSSQGGESMTKSEANRFMNEQFDNFAHRARNAETVEEEMKFTDAAHKIFITLTEVDAFESESGNTANLGS